ncbi:hypothetical protein [Singulisphaera sp. PoT]|uniref:hypothetical protein n=1 Tax=Singulisphaera sp. PoT TaxID=3411797 RepID=UPI003BF592A0
MRIETIDGESYEGELRLLDIAVRGDKAHLCMRIPTNEDLDPDSESKREIVVPLEQFRQAIQPHRFQIAGVTPIKRNPKNCAIETAWVTITIEGGPNSKPWEISVRRGEIEEKLNQMVG